MLGGLNPVIFIDAGFFYLVLIMENINLKNIKDLQQEYSIVVRRRVTGSNTRPRYSLVEPITITLSDRSIIYIPSGFSWDLSSVPRFLWGLLPPDGDMELASIIHDFLYISVDRRGRKFADDEMLLWSSTCSGTSNKVSLRNADNYLRYWAVRAFGWIVWNKNKRRKGL